MSDPSLIKSGEEYYISYRSRITKNVLIQYDYRNLDGELFSCIANDVEEARQKKDEWLKKKTDKVEQVIEKYKRS